MHTGYEYQQILNQWTHSNYENHVNSRWYSGFESLIANNYNYFWYTDWRQGTIDYQPIPTGISIHSTQGCITSAPPGITQVMMQLLMASRIIYRCVLPHTNGLARYAKS